MQLYVFLLCFRPDKNAERQYKQNEGLTKSCNCKQVTELASRNMWRNLLQETVDGTCFKRQVTELASRNMWRNLLQETVDGTCFKKHVMELASRSSWRNLLQEACCRISTPKLWNYLKGFNLCLALGTYSLL